MNWRQWIYDLLTNDPAVVALVGSNVFQGTLTEQPSVDQFIVVRFMPSNPGPFPGVYVERPQVWAHDRQDTYVVIDDILRASQTAVEQAAAQDEFITAVWEGDSQDQVDDAMNTNTRHAQFRLAATGRQLV